MTERSLHWVEPHDALPSPAEALTDPPGLLAAGRDLSPDRLIEAYSKGIFPWFVEGQPVLWWSPDPRMVLFVNEFRLSRSLRQLCRRMVRSKRWEITVDQTFDAVVDACARSADRDTDGTWITPKMRDAYGELHRRGQAHSVEIWADDGAARSLVGGLYGVSIGRMFFGESMFALQANSSKAALGALAHALGKHGFRVIDCQQATGHLASLGGREIDRASFLRHVGELTILDPPDWHAITLELPLA